MSEFTQKVSETITGQESPDEGRPGVDSPDGPRPEAFLGNGAGPDDDSATAPGDTAATPPDTDEAGRDSSDPRAGHGG